MHGGALQVGYVQGMGFIAGLLLLYMCEEDERLVADEVGPIQPRQLAPAWVQLPAASRFKLCAWHAAPTRQWGLLWLL